MKLHKVPEWFHDAKLGIFIHWGLFSVPAFAAEKLTLDESQKRGTNTHMKNNPYAEWYLNSLRIEGSPTQHFHNESYGDDFSYDRFAEIFNEEIKKWNPADMVDLIKKAGAKYVVLVTKHHDGFLLWPSKYPNPKKDNYIASRDIVGELTEVVKQQGLKMGLYYSGALDWSWNPNPIIDNESWRVNGPSEIEYTEYANNHWYELIDEYDPIILWNDIGYPPNTNVYEIFAYFYNKHPDGLINDRWIQYHKSDFDHPPVRHRDFATPEYRMMEDITDLKWESTRGIGYSFGYNKMETEKDYLRPDELIRMFIDIVSKNGNLLLNLGPTADGTIPELQKKAILGLGKWLEINGESIYGTRPWNRAEGKTLDDMDLRFTQKGETIYIHLFDKPKNKEIIIESLEVHIETKIQLLGHDKYLYWTQLGENLQVIFPESFKESPVYVFKLVPKTKV
ncbi:MAG: alpha-L-fucosidase [Candidatus Lokiarchaeota archaeon]|nr:alpha-L-fucosidase [Candidatus Lokiarchaeota archaeon]